MPSASRRVFAVPGWRLAAGLAAAALLLALSFAEPSSRATAQPPLRLAASGPWLDRLNAWRASTDVAALTENATWSSGDYNHALYMVKNNLVTHYETPGVPYYTTAGDAAARNGNIYISSSTSTSDTQAIDWWMQAPFHALGLMDPRLSTTGFGSYREVKSGWQMGAAVDVLRGNPFTGGHYPVYFPGNGSTEPLTAYGGNESPNPLSACPGYAAPSGLPVFIQVGGNVATTAGPAHSFVGNGTALEHCVIDSNNTSVGSGLKSRGAVILIPRLPLKSGVKYVVSLTVNGSPYTWSFTVGALGAAIKTPCTAVSATTTPAASAPAGAQITVTAASVGCPNPRYRFWVQAPGGPWVIKQDYSSADTFTWTDTTVAGDYRLEVDARDAPESVSYDVVTNFNYVLSGCSWVALGASPASPQYPTGVVTFTATPTCVGTPTYRFWVRPPGGAWTVRQDYSTNNAFSWPIAGLAPGTYGIEVDERSLGSSEPYQRVSNLSYVLAMTPCASATLGASPASPGATGSTVTLTASSTGCVSPQYRFWIRAPNGTWSMRQDYSASNTFAWSGTGQAGTYGIEVDVRDQLASVSYDTVRNITYVVTGCTAATLAATPANSAPRGTAVSLAATATCPGTPTYKFWIKAPGGAWTAAQQYSTSSTYAWMPTSAGTYYLEVDVRDQGAKDAYEKVSNLTYVVT
jgi:Cysteine-rich secretory protein family